MLNRRTIRIKIMQSLFAYQQCKEADLLLAHDYLEQHFSPDLNSMEVQDKEKLRAQKKSALQFFDKKMKKSDAESVDPVIAKRVEEAIALYHQAIKKDQIFLGKNILIDAEKLASLYHSVIALMVALADQAATDKKTDNKNFLQHPWIISWRENETLNKSIRAEHSGWETRTDKVRAWFREVVKEDEMYQSFIAEKTPSEESQKEFIKHLSRKIILGKTVINDYFDEQNIRWTEDKDIIKSMVDKTIKSYDHGKTTLQKLSLNWDEDKEFINKLFNAAIELDPQYRELIAKNTRNWEVDRLALTDRVIIEMAIAEMIHFPNIPVKVTINEYIELSKDYSTPKSRTFINGILDVISKSMKESGALKKSGRGLLDNK
ncbi:MAG: Transcription termination protein NusB [Cytophagales bacterium]|jgi:N utilization substance protein B|nr:transcription antitermination factor NusB [Bacteroidota bacterium]MBS1979845.1 transcription antitermination factor NusB [Bacteroidota bacterium]WHZ07131.1 MAG: Transcription termination protein NusB [Cytophagales bacterium]